MTEHQWCRSISPDTMLRAMNPRPSDRRGSTLPTRFSPRKKRLFMCACCRRLRNLLTDERSRGAVAVAEAFADGRADQAGRAAAQEEAAQAQYRLHTLPHATVTKALAVQRRSANVAVQAAWSSRWLEVHFVAVETAAILGDLAAPGDYLPTAAWRLASEQANREIAGLAREVFGNPFRPAPLAGARRSTTVASLARAAYDERQLPGGELDPERLAVLSDALEEAGAPDEMLAHLRAPGPHVRGCWAVDLCLGLS